MGLIRKLMLLLVFFTAASLLLADDELKVSCTIGLSGSKASVRFTDNDTNGNPIDRSTVHLDVDTENTFKASIMDGENLFLDYDIESAGNVDITLTLTGPFQRIVGDGYLDWKLTSERNGASAVGTVNDISISTNGLGSITDTIVSHEGNNTVAKSSGRLKLAIETDPITPGANYTPTQIIVAVVEGGSK